MQNYLDAEFGFGGDGIYDKTDVWLNCNSLWKQTCSESLYTVLKNIIFFQEGSSVGQNVSVINSIGCY